MLRSGAGTLTVYHTEVYITHAEHFHTHAPFVDKSALPVLCIIEVKISPDLSFFSLRAISCAAGERNLRSGEKQLCLPQL